MKKIKNVVFDFGGVVVDLERQQAVDRFVAMGVADAGDMLDPYHQHGVFLEVEDGSITGEEFCTKIREITGNNTLPYQQIAAGWIAFIKRVPQFKLDYMAALRNNYPVYLLSNTNPFVMDWARSTEFTPAGKTINDYVDKVYASCEIQIVKPHREIFDFMLKDSGMIPEETLFLDDGAANIKTAQELGFQTYQPYDGEDWREKVTSLLAL